MYLITLYYIKYEQQNITKMLTEKPSLQTNPVQSLLSGLLRKLLIRKKNQHKGLK